MQPARRRRLTTFAVAAVAAALAGAGCGSSSSTPTEGVSTTSGQPDTAAGRELFSRKCGICHTMADARTEGTLGPDLDQLQPGKERVLRQIQDGGGAMPADLVEGQDAEDVAAYVAEVAGRSGGESEPAP